MYGPPQRVARFLVSLLAPYTQTRYGAAQQQFEKHLLLCRTTFWGKTEEE